jgi:hypothetical protein
MLLHEKKRERERERGEMTCDRVTVARRIYQAVNFGASAE